MLRRAHGGPVRYTTWDARRAGFITAATGRCKPRLLQAPTHRKRADCKADARFQCANWPRPSAVNIPSAALSERASRTAAKAQQRHLAQ
jgi:hypothetical protein